jgi:hypothetical protein
MASAQPAVDASPVKDVETNQFSYPVFRLDRVEANSTSKVSMSVQAGEE